MVIAMIQFPKATYRTYPKGKLQVPSTLFYTGQSPDIALLSSALR